jgi:hypothetical protein
VLLAGGAVLSQGQTRLYFIILAAFSANGGVENTKTMYSSQMTDFALQIPQ